MLLVELKKTELPNVLYHASAYKQKELMPGFKRSGVEEKWDKTENNHFLYATSDREEAVDLGIASAIEHQFQLTRFHTDGNDITIEADESITLKDLEALNVYLYTVNCDENDGWMKNNNGQNHLTTEYKTKKTVKDISKCTKINMSDWLSGKNVKFK